MIVMTGANGRLGRLIAQALVRRGAVDRVTLATRDPAKIADLVALGFRATRADFGDPASLHAAFSGASSVLMISMPGPVEARIPLHRNAFDALKAAGVGRVLYTSRVNPAPQSLYPFAPVHVFSESYLRSTGLPSTILRNSEYVENIGWLVKRAAESGQLILPGRKGRVSYMGVADIAEITARVLIEDGHAGKTYELNGPEALSRDEIAALIAAATGRAIEVVPISRDDYGDFMRNHGRPPFVVEMLRGFYEAIDADEFAAVWPDAERLLGRPAATVADFVRRMVAPPIEKS
jgi:NAD(P)H dehydrogenase (quinone)